MGLSFFRKKTGVSENFSNEKKHQGGKPFGVTLQFVDNEESLPSGATFFEGNMQQAKRFLQANSPRGKAVIYVTKGNVEDGRVFPARIYYLTDSQITASVLTLAEGFNREVVDTLLERKRGERVA